MNEKEKNKHAEERIKDEKERFDRLMEDLDLNGDGNVTKKEFVDAYNMKYQQLIFQKMEIEEDLEDLETKFK